MELTEVIEREVQPSGVAALDARSPEAAKSLWEDVQRSRLGLRELVRRLHQQREDEARRIAREVRDELGGLLTRLKMELSLQDRDLPADQRSQELELVDQGLATLQRICSTLRPPALDDLGLVPAIESAVAAFGKSTGIPIAATLDHSIRTIDPQIASGLFRILEQALANVRRHARASHVVVRLRAVDGSMRLAVTDNGIGIPTGRLSDPTALGLIGMRERAMALGGTVTIRTASMRGTTVEVRVPLARDMEASA